MRAGAWPRAGSPSGGVMVWEREATRTRSRRSGPPALRPRPAAGSLRRAGSRRPPTGGPGLAEESTRSGASRSWDGRAGPSVARGERRSDGQARRIDGSRPLEREIAGQREAFIGRCDEAATGALGDEAGAVGSQQHGLGGRAVVGERGQADRAADVEALA